MSNPTRMHQDLPGAADSMRLHSAKAPLRHARARLDGESGA